MTDTRACPYNDCPDVFTGPDAGIAVANHVSGVHIHAAGAVRRTQDLIDTAAKAIVANPNLVAAVVKACKCCTSDHYEPGGGAPYPAECRWCDHEPNRHGEAELAKLRIPVMDSLGDLIGDAGQRRPVVLLRAEDCACPVGGDCPHGPEPVDALDLAVWLHAEAQHRLAEEQTASYNMYAKVFQALGVSITEPWSGLADAARKVAAERDALLPRLAELAEASGKLRTAEWLRTCATLPMEEWPPAPAYKGPMAPAADLEEAQRSAKFWQGQAEYWEREHDNTVLPYTNKLESERDALQTRVDDLKRSYELKVQDFAQETARVSAGLRACTVTPTNEHVPREVVGEALLGWRAAQEHIGDAIRNGALRAALQGQEGK